MKGRAKIIRDNRNDVYKVFARNYFWQKWEPLLDNNGKQIEFKTFKEFSEVTKIESFGVIEIKFDNFQGM